MLIKIGATPSASEDLVDLLLACHDRIRSFTALARAAGERADALPSDVADACSRVERYFTEALPFHLRDEEESLVPRLEGHSPEVDRALVVMKEQHARHEPILHTFLCASAALRRNPGDAPLRHELARAASELEREFGEHLALEETVLFPAIPRLLGPALQTEIKEELRRRREPR
jgi:iron-sulfur cluster repair protein YtfE (RIC family)